MNKEQLLNDISDKLYDIDSSVEAVKEDFEEYDIDVEIFLETISLYIKHFEILKKADDLVLLNLLNKKLSFIISNYTGLSYANKQIKASINFIEKHVDTFFDSTILKEKSSPINLEKYQEKQSIYLDAIKIKNYFSLLDIEIINLKNKKEIYFVGENGDGKTILLQAILLALKKRYSGFVREYIDKVKDKDMVLSIKDENSKEYVFDLNIQNIFAYGINRNKVHYNDFDKYGYGGLFDTSDSRRTTYLRDPFYELGKEYTGDNILIKEFIKVLNSQILQENYKIFNGGKVDFTELSEGYKSTIIWLYDLVSRLIKNQQKIKNLKDFKAIVLIDEVDLYLHPKWKYNFVYNLRKIFPKIQFIMITHSTATILGASEDAIFYKVYKEGKETKISQPMNNIKNFMANNLTTSPLFDMDTARARNNDNNLDTREDFIASKIHKIIKKRVKGKKAIVEDDIEDMINQELDKFLKENNL